MRSGHGIPVVDFPASGGDTIICKARKPPDVTDMITSSIDITNYESDLVTLRDDARLDGR
jgi:hypothetical protein